MKTSQFSGKHIFEKIHKIHNEIKELEEALDAVTEAGFEDNSVPFKILKDQYEGKRRELREAESTIYVVKVEEALGFKL